MRIEDKIKRLRNWKSVCGIMQNIANTNIQIKEYCLNKKIIIIIHKSLITYPLSSAIGVTVKDKGMLPQQKKEGCDTLITCHLPYLLLGSSRHSRGPRHPSPSLSVFQCFQIVMRSSSFVSWSIYMFNISLYHLISFVRIFLEGIFQAISRTQSPTFANSLYFLRIHQIPACPFFGVIFLLLLSSSFANFLDSSSQERFYRV